MRRLIRGTSIGLWVAAMATVVPSSAEAAGWRGTARPVVLAGCAADTGRPARQVSYDQRTGVLTTVQIDPGGTATLEARAGDLEVHKVVRPNGHFRLVLQVRADRVTITANGATVEVQRGDEVAAVDASAPNDEALLRVRSVLAGSRPIRLFRALVTNVEPAFEQSPAGAALLLSDALVGLLDGDIGAIERLGRGIAARRAARLRPAHFSNSPGCFEIYEAEVIRAWIDYQECRNSFAWWNPLKEGCTLRWMLWAESAWFSFIGCSAVPIAR